LEEGSEAKKKQLADEICQALTVHTQIEEELFYPAAHEEIDDGDLMDEALVEHAGAKELIAQISAMQPGEDLYDAKVKVLSEQITHHVREEESDMFPKVRGTALDLVDLGAAMSKRKQELQMAET
jgi:hemerythrin superfamily protein